MKLIIAGGQDLKITMNLLKGIIMAYDIDLASIKEIICGDRSGVDAGARGFAAALNLRVNYFLYKPELGDAAVSVRNRAMVDAGDALLLLWNCHSKGSLSMKTEARNKGIPIWEVILSNPPSKRMLEKMEKSIS